MKVTLEFITSTRQFSSKLYLNNCGELALGYNHTLGINKGSVCTQSEALIWLQQDIKAIHNVLYRHFPYKLTVNQRAALTSLIYDIGLETFLKSRLYYALKEGGLAEAATLFLNYPAKGLQTIRQQEMLLFSTV